MKWRGADPSWRSHLTSMEKAAPLTIATLEEQVQYLAKLSDIEEITNVAELPQFLADSNKRVREAAKKKLKELQGEYKS